MLIVLINTYYDEINLVSKECFVGRWELEIELCTPSQISCWRKEDWWRKVLTLAEFPFIAGLEPMFICFEFYKWGEIRHKSQKDLTSLHIIVRWSLIAEGKACISCTPLTEAKARLRVNYPIEAHGCDEKQRHIRVYTSVLVILTTLQHA